MTATLWDRQAAQFRLLGPPLRPSQEDLATASWAAWQWSRDNGPPRMLVLGATPDFAALPWPSGSSLRAVDRSPAMIERVWPGCPFTGEAGLCADWLAMAMPDDSHDVVLADGSFVQVPFPQAQEALLDKLRWLLAPGGRAIVRLFLQQDIPESPAAVIARARAGKIANFHEFKLRLLMACQSEPSEGIALADLWLTWRAACEDLDSSAIGWSPEQVSTLDAYRDEPARYHFCTLAQMRALIAPYFREIDCRTPRYRLGDRFPTLVLEPRPRAARRLVA